MLQSNRKELTNEDLFELEKQTNDQEEKAKEEICNENA